MCPITVLACCSRTGTSLRHSGQGTERIDSPCAVPASAADRQQPPAVRVVTLLATLWQTVRPYEASAPSYPAVPLRSATILRSQRCFTAGPVQIGEGRPRASGSPGGLVSHDQDRYAPTFQRAVPSAVQMPSAPRGVERHHSASGIGGTTDGDVTTSGP